jgi:hypothetical protein
MRNLALFLMIGLTATSALAQNDDRALLPGAWVSRQGPQLIVYFKFYPNGGVIMEGYQGGDQNSNITGAYSIQESGYYQFDGTTLRFRFDDYEPKGQIAPPGNLGAVNTVQIQFQSENVFITSDGATYERTM